MTAEPTFRSAVRALGDHGLASLEAVFEAAPFGVYIDDPSLGCTYANPALLAQFGARAARLAGALLRTTHGDSRAPC